MLSELLALATLVTADVAPPSAPPPLLQEMIRNGEGAPEKGMPFPKETIVINGEVGARMLGIPGPILLDFLGDGTMSSMSQESQSIVHRLFGG